jgi:hypothetical protein
LDVSPKLLALDFGDHGYLGMSTLIALVVGVIAGYRCPLVWFFLAVGSVSLLLSDGFFGWGRELYALYARLPAGATFRQPERLRLLTLFSAIAIASVGFNEFGKGPLRERSQAAFRAAIVAATLATAIIVTFGGWAAAWRAGLTLVGLGVAVRWARRPAVRRLGQALILVLLVVDLAQAMARTGCWRSFPKGWNESFHFLGHTAIDGAEYERLREQVGLNRLSVHGMLPLTGAGPIGGAYQEACYETLLPRAWGTLNAKIRGTADRKVGGPRLSNRNLFDVDPVKFATFYDVAGVRLIVRVVTPDPADRSAVGAILKAHQAAMQTRAAPWPALPAGITVERLVNDDALDRAYFVNRFAVASTDDALDRVISGSVDFRGTVLLDRDPGAADRGATARYHPATIVSYEPERVVIDVDAPTAGFVVLSDTDYPGWRARVDDEDVEIFRANGLYRAVAVSRGRHRITFEYRPASLAWGFRIAAVSAGLLVLLPLVRKMRRA